MPKKTTASSDESLAQSMRNLDMHMEKLAQFYKPQRFLWLGFIRGIVYGLGIVVAIAIVLPIILWLLSTIDWIPYIGDLVSEIISRMESAQRPY